MYTIKAYPEKTDKYISLKYWVIHRPDGSALPTIIYDEHNAEVLCMELNSLIQEEEDHADV